MRHNITRTLLYISRTRWYLLCLTGVLRKAERNIRKDLTAFHQAIAKTSLFVRFSFLSLKAIFILLLLPFLLRFKTLFAGILFYSLHG